MSQNGSSLEVAEITNETDAVEAARSDERLTEGDTQELPNGAEQVWFDAADENTAAEYHNNDNLNTNQQGINYDGMDGARVAIVIGESNSDGSEDLGPNAEYNRQKEAEVTEAVESHWDNRNNY